MYVIACQANYIAIICHGSARPVEHTLRFLLAYFCRGNNALYVVAQDLAVSLFDADLSDARSVDPQCSPGTTGTPGWPCRAHCVATHITQGVFFVCASAYIWGRQAPRYLCLLILIERQTGLFCSCRCAVPVDLPCEGAASVINPSRCVWITATNTRF